MQKNLNYAIRLIKRTTSLREGEQNPYFFVVGAGISMPEIPSAHQIVELCKKEVQKTSKEEYDNYLLEYNHIEKNPMQSYSKWISYAYPNKIDRSNFFKKLIKRSKISTANLLLAQILNSKKIASTVITTNFDDKLKQALDLLGIQDVFVSATQIDNLIVNPSSKEIQIVHVHGNYNFYDCANLTKEIEGVSKETGFMSSSHILHEFLKKQAPIFIGYSGWEGDVVMTALKERLKASTPLNYIWICYSHEAYNFLPDWLKESEQIDFILPDEELNLTKDDKEQKISFSQLEELTPHLEATTFFKKLIFSLNIEQPEILQNPYTYYYNLISKYLPDNENVLHLRHWANSMKSLEKHENEVSKLILKTKKSIFDENLEAIKSNISNLISQNLEQVDFDLVYELIFNHLLDYLHKRKEEQVFLIYLEILAFIRKQHTRFLKDEDFANKLEELAYHITTLGDFEKVGILFDKVLTLPKIENNFLAIYLKVLATKFHIVKTDYEKLSIAETILSKTAKQEKDKDLIYIRAVTFLNKATLDENKNRDEDIKEAEKYFKLTKDNEINKRLLSTFSTLVSTLNEGESLKYANRFIDLYKKLKEELPIATRFDLFSSFYSLDYDTLIKIKNFKPLLLELVNEQPSKLSACTKMVTLSKIYVVLIIITKDLHEKSLYIKKILNLHNESSCVKCDKKIATAKNISTDKEKTVFFCLSFINQYIFAVKKLCILKTKFASDEEKIGALLNLKTLIKEQGNKIINLDFQEVLKSAIKNGNEKNYHIKELAFELQRINESNKLYEAYELYLKKEHKQAEQLLLELLETTDTQLKHSVANNLAFMVRRNETSITTKTFIQLFKICNKKDIFPNINIALYYLMSGKACKKCKEALKIIASKSTEEREEATNFWSNVELVGKEESELALKILTGEHEI